MPSAQWNSDLSMNLIREMIQAQSDYFSGLSVEESAGYVPSDATYRREVNIDSSPETNEEVSIPAKLTNRMKNLGLVIYDRRINKYVITERMYSRIVGRAADTHGRRSHADATHNYQWVNPVLDEASRLHDSMFVRYPEDV